MYTVVEEIPDVHEMYGLPDTAPVAIRADMLPWALRALSYSTVLLSNSTKPKASPEPPPELPVLIVTPSLPPSRVFASEATTTPGHRKAARRRQRQASFSRSGRKVDGEDPICVP
jgi:hypothetical protein